LFSLNSLDFLLTLSQTFQELFGQRVFQFYFRRSSLFRHPSFATRPALADLIATLKEGMKMD